MGTLGCRRADVTQSSLLLQASLWAVFLQASLTWLYMGESPLEPLSGITKILCT